MKIGFLEILALGLIFLKAMNYIDWHWGLVLIPVWIKALWAATGIIFLALVKGIMVNKPPSYRGFWYEINELVKTAKVERDAKKN